MNPFQFYTIISLYKVASNLFINWCGSCLFN